MTHQEWVKLLKTIFFDPQRFFLKVESDVFGCGKIKRQGNFPFYMNQSIKTIRKTLQGTFEY